MVVRRRQDLSGEQAPQRTSPAPSHGPGGGARGGRRTVRTVVGQLQSRARDRAGRLDENDRELVRLWAWEQLEPREIAIVVGTTANAVSLQLTWLKKKLANSIVRQSRAGAGHEGYGHTREVGS